MNIIKKLLAAVAACTLACASQVSAITLAIDDIYYLGSAEPGTPADAINQVAWINALVGLAPNGTSNAGDHNSLITRSANVFGALPLAVLTGADANNNTVEGEVANIDVTGWTYLLGKFGQNSHIWYVGSLNETVTLPAGFGRGAGLSNWGLFNPSTTNTPDGGSMLVLLGAAVTVLGFLRRKISA